MPLWIPDISHHQGDINLQGLIDSGAAALIARVGQGAGRRRDGSTYGTTRDRKWTRNRDGWRQVTSSRPLVGYWYIGSLLTAADNAELCAEWMGDTTIPVMLDWEDASGTASHYQDCLVAFARRGLRVVLGYCPRWYWTAMGGGSLAGPPLVNSRYVAAGGPPAAIYPGDNAAGWLPYGGNTVALLQFTNKAAMAGQAIDCSAYRGTHQQLAALLGGAQEDDVSFNEELVSAWNPDYKTTASVWITTTAGKVEQLQESVARLEQAVAALSARPAADVDEQALAAALAAHGIGGLTAAQLVDIIASVRLTLGGSQ